MTWLGRVVQIEGIRWRVIEESNHDCQGNRRSALRLTLEEVVPEPLQEVLGAHVPCPPATDPGKVGP